MWEIYRTNKRKTLYKWLEEFKVITIDVCKEMLFKENVNPYEGARQFLNRLVKEDKLKSYDCKFYNKTFKVYSYPHIKEKKFHEVYQIIYMWKLKSIGLDFLWKYESFDRLARPDLIIAYKLGDKINVDIIEIDYTHYTNLDKIKRYEKLVQDNYFVNKWGFNPSLTIISKRKTITFESDFINIHFLQFDDDINKLKGNYQLI